MSAASFPRHPMPAPIPRRPANAGGDTGVDFAALAWIEEFAALALRALAAEDDERERSRCEDELLRRVPYLRAAGVFEVFQIADPALRAMIADHARG